MGHIPTSTKLAQTSKPTKDVVKTSNKPTHELKTQLECDLVIIARLDPQTTPTDQEYEYAVVARRILTKNPNIAQQMIEQLKAHPGKLLQSEEFQTVTKPIETPS